MGAQAAAAAEAAANAAQQRLRRKLTEQRLLQLHVRRSPAVVLHRQLEVGERDGDEGGDDDEPLQQQDDFSDNDF